MMKTLSGEDQYKNNESTAPVINFFTSGTFNFFELSGGTHLADKKSGEILSNRHRVLVHHALS